MLDIKSLMGSNIVVKRTPAARVESSIILIPETVVNYDKLVAEVVKVGPGEVMGNGEREPIPLKEGDRVIVYQGYGHELGDNHFIVDVSEIELRVDNDL